MEKRLLNEREAATYIGMSPNWLKKIRSTGPLPGWTTPPPFLKMGGRAVRYDIRDLDAWIQAGREGGTPMN